MHFEVRNRYTGDLQFTAEIECAEGTLTSIKLGLAVRWAVANKADLKWADLRWAVANKADLRWADLSGANLSGADLSEANLSGADLSGADLSGADLGWANLNEVDLRWANLRWANLRWADLNEVDLRWANLSGANLKWANFSGANLSEANLRGANLSGAKLIISFGPIGEARRIGYAVKHENGPMIQLGCFWGTLDEAAREIRLKHGENSTYENLVRAACAVLD